MSDFTIIDAIAQLEGYTADEVAQLLRLADKKGHLQVSRSCPLANYFNDVLNSEECSVGPYTAFGEDSVPHRLPTGLSSFVADFDNGLYPDLIEEILE